MGIGNYIKTSVVVVTIGGVMYFLDRKYHWYDKLTWRIKEVLFTAALNKGRNQLRKHVRDVYIDRDSGYIYDSDGKRIGRELF